MCLEAIKTQGLQETKLSIIDDQSSFNGLTPEDLLRVGFGWGRPMLFVADAETMKGEGSLLCFDMAGVQRRVAPCELTEVLNTAPSGAQAIAQMLGSLFEDTSNGIRFKADSPWASGEATTEIDERSPLVRTDFSNDPAWHATLELIRA